MAKKKESQSERIHKSQDKNNCFVSIGDTVKITCDNGDCISGVVMCYDLKKETTSEYPGLHMCVDLAVLPYDAKAGSYSDMVSIWIENIVDLIVLKFKGEVDMSVDDFVRENKPLIEAAFNQEIPDDRLSFFCCYDTLADMAKDFFDMADESKPYVKKVLDKWIIQLA